MAKIPFCMILCKCDGAKCRKICNGLRDPFKWLVMQKNILGGFKCKKIGDSNSTICVWSTIENTVNLRVSENSKEN